MKKNINSEKILARVGDFFIPKQVDLIGNSMRTYGEWAQNEIDLLSHFIQPGQTVLDVGAYIGTHARSFSTLVGENGMVYAFEPNFDNFMLLENNIICSPIKNILKFNFGLGREGGLYLDTAASSNINKGANELSKIKVQDNGIEVKSIDQWRADINFNFIKIDVEGMEMDVLYGAREAIHRCMPIIFLEINSIDASYELLSWSRSNGYRCFGVISKAFNDNNFNGSKYDIFNSASECGALLIPKDWINFREVDFQKLGIVELENIDDLALMLLHKPQYPYEILAARALSNSFGINYPSPLSAKLDLEIIELNKKINDKEDLIHELSIMLEATNLDLNHKIKEKQDQIDNLSENYNEARSYINRIEKSKIFRYSRSIANLKYSFDQWRNPSVKIVQNNALHSKKPLQRPNMPVDVIVPVYRGLQDTQQCINSVLASVCRTDWRLIIINDCSPEQEVTEWLRSVATRDSRIELLENGENLGFVGTVNRGMRMHPDRDVLLLNSDAEVANDWLDRLQAAAYSQSGVSSVTPFSNNATICSYPRFCAVNDLPAGWSTAELDALCAKHLAGQAVAVPTGVGFCMYIRRESLQEVGLFDEANFGKGYGEENDFCVRADTAGWIHLHALDVFVQHAGGVSFGESKSERELLAMSTMNRLHPDYDSSVHRFIAQDPAASARERLDLARIVDGKRPLVVMVTHNRDGGTLRHVQEMALHLAKHVTFLMLRPSEGGVVLSLPGSHEAWKLHFTQKNAYKELIEYLRGLGVSHIHYHHLLGHELQMSNLAADLGVTHDFTAHDYYSYCPQISLTNTKDQYCGENGLQQCAQCLVETPAPGHSSIEDWRSRYAPLLKSARFLLTPSQDTARRMQKFVPGARIVVAPHSSLQLQPVCVRNPAAVLTHGVLRVVLLGGLSRIKGADVLEKVAILAARDNLPIEFHLIGYSYRHLATQPRAALTVHGHYDDADLKALLRSLAPDVAWFPSQCPETYSYTLSACLEAGLPVVSTNLGALVERLEGRAWSWVLDWKTAPETWVQFFCDIRERHFVTGTAPQPVSVANTSDRTVPIFSYRKDYFEGLQASTPELPLSALRRSFSSARNLASQDASRFSVKAKTLNLLIYMKRSTYMSWLTRLISTATQRKIKSWLLR